MKVNMLCCLMLTRIRLVDEVGIRHADLDRMTPVRNVLNFLGHVLVDKSNVPVGVKHTLKGKLSRGFLSKADIAPFDDKVRCVVAVEHV